MKSRRILTAITIALLLTLTLASTQAYAEQRPNICGWLKNVSTTVWTPVILLNPPYGTTATASALSSVSYQGQYTVFGIGSSTSTTSGRGISGSNGQMVGLFELDTWTHYSWSCNPNQYMDKITSTSGVYYSTTIGSSSTYSHSSGNICALWNGVNYCSVTFTGNNYQTNNNGATDTCGYVAQVLQITTSSTTNEGFSLTFSPSQYVTSGNLNIAVTYGQGYTISYTYNFPANGGIWYQDSLNGQSGSGQGAEAFSWVHC